MRKIKTFVFVIFLGIAAFGLAVTGMSGTANAAIVSISETFDLGNGSISDGLFGQKVFNVGSTSSPISLQNGDTLEVNFSFLNGQGLTIFNNVVHNGTQLSEILGVGVSLVVPGQFITTTNSLTNLVVDGNPSGGAFSSTVFGYEHITSGVKTDITPSVVTIFSGIYQLQVNSGIGSLTAGSLSGLRAFGGDFAVVSAVPVPPALILFGSGLIALVGIGRLRRRKKDHATA